MKKTICALLLIVLVVSFVACKSEKYTLVEFGEITFSYNMKYEIVDLENESFRLDFEEEKSFVYITRLESMSALVEGMENFQHNTLLQAFEKIDNRQDYSVEVAETTASATLFIGNSNIQCLLVSFDIDEYFYAFAFTQSINDKPTVDHSEDFQLLLDSIKVVG